LATPKHKGHSTTMKFALAIYAAPFSSQASQSAFNLASALLQQNHQIYRVFFYQGGIQNGNAMNWVPQDEQDLCRAWQSLAREYSLDLVVCIAAALRRGLFDQIEAERYQRDCDNLAQGFSIGGLGQLIDAAAHADRLISFGA